MRKKKVRIFRMIHYSNLPFILQNGLHCALCDIKDPNYVSIGDQRLIKIRNEWPVPIHPNGTLGDYIPFYFSSKTPMLYNIAKGRVEGCPSEYQYETIYLVSSVEKIIELSLPYLFTDRHACLAITNFFDNYQQLPNLSWSIINDNEWHMRYSKIKKELKQAEFLVHKCVPTDAVEGIITHSEEINNKINMMFQEFKVNLQTVVRPEYYYPI